jgi:hypothetical protein
MEYFMKEYNIQYPIYNIFYHFIEYIILTVFILFTTFIVIKYFKYYDLLIIFIIIVSGTLLAVGIFFVLDSKIDTVQFKNMNILFYDDFVKFNYEHRSRTFYFNRIINIKLIFTYTSSFLTRGREPSSDVSYNITIEQENDNERINFSILLYYYKNVEQNKKIFNEFYEELKLKCEKANIVYEKLYTNPKYVL